VKQNPCVMKSLRHFRLVKLSSLPGKTEIIAG